MIIVDNLTVKFDEKIILNNLNFELPKGGKYAVAGPSGAGKSTLLNVLMGFAVPSSGKVIIDGSEVKSENIESIRSKIAWVPQELHLQVNGVKDLVQFPFSFKRNKKISPGDREISKILSTFGLDPDILNKQLNDISGGEKQRIVLSVAVLLKRQLVFLDEITSALDRGSRIKVMDYFFNQPDLTVLAVTHDDEWMKRSDKIIHLNL